MPLKKTMNAEFKVTALIPVAGRPELLTEAIQSVIASTQPPTELIVVVDSVGEPKQLDESAARKACRTAPFPWSILASDGRGPAAARNTGAVKARGDWLAFLDSDDLWLPNKLAAQRDYLQKRPHLHGCQTREEWRKQDGRLNQPARLRPRPGRFLGAALHTCLISPSAVMLRRETFLELGKFDESFPACEDFELWLRWLLRYPMGLVPEALTMKRAGDWPQQSRTIPSLDAWRIQAILKTVRERGEEFNPQERRGAQGACLQKLAILERGADKYASEARLNELRAAVEETFPPEDSGE